MVPKARLYSAKTSSEGESEIFRPSDHATDIGLREIITFEEEWPRPRYGPGRTRTGRRNLPSDVLSPKRRESEPFFEKARTRRMTIRFKTVSHLSPASAGQLMTATQPRPPARELGTEDSLIKSPACEVAIPSKRAVESLKRRPWAAYEYRFEPKAA